MNRAVFARATFIRSLALFERQRAGTTKDAGDLDGFGLEGLRQDVILLAMQRGMSIQTIRPDLGELLRDPANTPDTIAVVLGGPMGVNQRNDPKMHWLRLELEWLSSWHRQKKPVLGICLGAQLLAVAAQKVRELVEKARFELTGERRAA